jgi:ABC-type nitrate/sulfonate/bicarbonate transport system substrate-binding protein
MKSISLSSRFSKQFFLSRFSLFFCASAMSWSWPLVARAQKPEASLSAKPKLTPFLVALDWTPNTNHTGLYVAKEQGLFEKSGLDVRFLQPTQTTGTALVAARKAQVAVSFTSDLIQARAQKLPVYSVAAIIQENTSCFAWRASANISSPKDWEGKRYGGWGSPEEEAALRDIMKKSGADFSKLKVVVSGISDFLATTPKNADFMWIYMGWDGIRAKLAGVEIKTLCPKDIAPNFNHHSPLLIANSQISKNATESQRLKDFLKATSQGYQMTIENPQKAGELLLKQVPELDAKLVMESAKFLAPEYAKGAPRWGVQKEEVWSRSLKWNRDQKLSAGKEPASTHFTNAFLP